MSNNQILCPRCGGTPLKKETEKPNGDKTLKKKCVDCGTTWYDPVN